MIPRIKMSEDIISSLLGRYYQWYHSRRLYTGIFAIFPPFYI